MNLWKPNQETVTMRDLLHEVYAVGISSEAFMARHVADHGRDFVPIARPRGIRKGADKLCFANAQRRVLGGGREIYGDAQYVEGFACSHRADNPIPHGWITLDGVHAIDVTWRTPGSRYFGIVLETKAIADHLLEIEAWGAMLIDMMRPAYEEYRRHIDMAHLRKSLRGKKFPPELNP